MLDTVVIPLPVTILAAARPRREPAGAVSREPLLACCREAETPFLDESIASADVMRELLIACPATEAPVRTNVFLRPEQFEDPGLKWSTYSVRCPHCSDVHRWTKTEAA